MYVIIDLGHSKKKVEIKFKNCAPLVTKRVTQIWVPRGINHRNLVVSKKSWIPKLT